MTHDLRNRLNTANLDEREMPHFIDHELDRMDRLFDEAAQVARTKASELLLKKEVQNLASLIGAAIQRNERPCR